MREETTEALFTPTGLATPMSHPTQESTCGVNPPPPSLPPKHVVEHTTSSSPQKYVVQQMRPHAPSTSPQKHVIELSSATTTGSNKKRKESYYDVSYSPVFRDVEKKAKTGVEHSLCFNPKYRALLSNASKSAHPPRPFTLLGRIEFPIPSSSGLCVPFQPWG